ncbi:GGDEF domain-containing protein [Ruminococcus sp. HUN007]|uniref:GGDEF domain-containing protein n=1 Tax=Ruminococcus sp. HUN007 TaxID=1514668 RepID=UPI0005D199D8|nr:GGDEF domain-containing protein [Ruminococcus sp. HUN007]
MVYYAELNILGFFTCLIIQHKEAKDKQEIFSTRSFKNILLIIESIFLLDTASLLIQNDMMPHTHIVHLMIMNGYFFLQALFPLEILKYCMGVEKIRSRTIRILTYIPMIITFAVLVVNSVKPFAFQIGENDKYSRLSSTGFVYVVIWPIVYVLGGLFFLIAYYRKSTDIKRENYRHIIIFAMFGFMAGILSILFKGFLLWPFISLGLIYLYVNVLSKSNQKLDILAFKDSLTGVGNAALYESVSGHIKAQIDAGTAEFALVVMDANSLKKINDNFGHEAGNEYIRTSARFICRIFDHSPIFRIGGDEFVTILEHSDYENREELLRRFDTEILHEKAVSDGVEFPLSIARGMKVYEKGLSFSEVFYEADNLMYANKSEVKKKATAEFLTENVSG